MKNRILLVSALALSLSAGLALADDTAGSAAKSRFPGWHNYREHVISQLPADKAQLYRDSMKKAHEENQARFDEEDKLEIELHDILTADKFDKKAFLDKTSQLQAVREKISQSMSESFASVAAQMTPDQRQVLAKLRRSGKPHTHGKPAAAAPTE